LKARGRVFQPLTINLHLTGLKWIWCIAQDV
jgi:hypothetical protein